MARRREKVLLAMSGGVDSSVAAALLCEAGFEVVGISMNLHSCTEQRGASCCSARDRMDARAVCARLDIAHAVVDLRSRFRERVMDSFVADYLRGRTPSPCIRCNEFIKFPALLAEAARLGCDLIATGHYARAEGCGRARRLMRAVDRVKDQSYFLFSIGREALSRVVFPLGEMTKAEVRANARALGFENAGKGESQEVCFAPDGDYAAFIERSAPRDIPGPGELVDSNGDVVGRHRGVHLYTVGQRRGLGAGFGARRYVVSIDAGKNRVVLGSDDALMRDRMTVADLRWMRPEGARPCRAVVKIRSAHAGADANVEPKDGGRALVTFDEPVRAIAPGQAAVFYDGDEVVGGGWIE